MASRDAAGVRFTRVEGAPLTTLVVYADDGHEEEVIDAADADYPDDLFICTGCGGSFPVPPLVLYRRDVDGSLLADEFCQACLFARLREGQWV